MDTHHHVMSHTPPHCHTHQLSPSMMANRMTMTKKKNVMSNISLTPSWSYPMEDRITSAAGQEAGTQQDTPHPHSHVLCPQLKMRISEEAAVNMALCTNNRILLTNATSRPQSMLVHRRIDRSDRRNTSKAKTKQG